MRCAALCLALAGSRLLMAAGLQNTAQQSPPPQETPYRLQVHADRVLVPVVVRNPKGQTVNGLQKDDFEVYDDGKPRTISGFTVMERGASGGKAAKSPQQVTPDGVVLPGHITVFLFDDMHLSVDDLAYARNAGVNALPGVLGGTDMAAVVSISGRVNTGLTRDRTALEDALKKLSPERVYQTDGVDCPSIDYYEADLIENKHDPVAVQDANQKYANCNPSVAQPQSIGGGPNLPTAQGPVDAAAMRALNLGHQGVQTAYAAIANMVRHMAPLPGERSLILVSPGFLNVERDSLDAESRIIDLAIRSNVIISSLDARGLYTTVIGASERSPALGGRSFQVNAEYHGAAMRLAENTMAELADGTGGTYFHNSNDLDAGMKELTEAPGCVYVLELPLDGLKRNGSFHRLKVKVHLAEVDVEARRGYFINDEKHEKKQ
jgi:VWFA-related protein